MNSMYKHIKFEVDQQFVSITLNRPEQLNALSQGCFEELKRALLSLKQSSGIKILILRGEGKTFCAGGDVQLFAKALALGKAEQKASIRQYISLAHEVMALLAALPMPLLVVVKGAAAGFGLSLCCIADFLIATDSSRFIPAYIGLGATPDGGLSYTLPRLLGERRATELLLQNKSFSAEQAQNWGFANAVVPLEGLEETVANYAQKAISAPQDTQSNTLTLLHEGRLSELKQNMDYELEAFVAGMDSDNFREGVTAFMQRRTPIFR